MSQNKKSITFLVPTKDRPKFLKKLLSRCSKLFSKIDHKYIVIDASNSINQLKNKKILKKYKNIKIHIQKSKGVQRGCMEVIPKIKTKFVTFLYDDDILGDNILTIYKNYMNNENKFSFGHGIVSGLKNKINFKKLQMFEIDKYEMLSFYFGSNINKKINYKNFQKNIVLPVSPICTCFKTKFLIKWKNIVNKFTYKNSFREYFLLKKDIGPDLLVFLININNSKKNINFYSPYSVKFSSHENSISIIYGSNLLRIGYWLSRICFYNINYKKNHIANQRAFTYLILMGIYLIFTNIFNFYFLKNILKELFILIIFKNNKFLPSYLFNILKSRFNK